MTKIVTVFIAAYFTVVQAGDGAEKVKTIMLKDCQEKSGASMVDLEAIRARRLPETRKGLCMLDCILNNVKILKNGKYNKTGMMLVFTPAMRGNITRLNKLKEFTELCETEIGLNNEECTIGKKVVECLAQHGKEYGISLHKNSKGA